MQSLSLLRLEVVPPFILATSALTLLVMKLLRFVAEAKKLSNRHRTPISSSMFGPGRRDLTSLKWPTAHKFLNGYKPLLTFSKLLGVTPIQLNPFFVLFKRLDQERDSLSNSCGIATSKGQITVAVIGADQGKSKMVEGIPSKAEYNV